MSNFIFFLVFRYFYIFPRTQKPYFNGCLLPRQPFGNSPNRLRFAGLLRLVLKVSPNYLTVHFTILFEAITDVLLLRRSICFFFFMYNTHFSAQIKSLFSNGFFPFADYGYLGIFRSVIRKKINNNHYRCSPMPRLFVVHFHLINRF